MKQLTKEQLQQVLQEQPEWVKLSNGKWYAHKTNGIPLVFKTGDDSGYGFAGNPQKNWWVENEKGWSFSICPSEWREASNEEVEKLLINEAKKRGYKAGVNTKFGKISSKRWKEFEWNDIGLYCYNILIYKSDKGRWTPIESEDTRDIHVDIQALKDKYPDYNLTIIAEKK